MTAQTGQNGVDLLADYRATAGASVVGTTVMGVLIQQSAGVSAGTGTYATAWRIGLIVDTSTSAVAELPAPDTDFYADWMWNSRYYLGNNTVGWIDDDAFEVRVKARRKLGELQETLWIVTQPELGGATSLNYDAHVRVLLALP